LLIYDPDYTDIQDVTNDFDSLHPNLKFTTELETNNKLNYLDITIHRTPNTLEKLNIQETHLYKLNHPILLQPSCPAQICCNKISLQQATHIQPA